MKRRSLGLIYGSIAAVSYGTNPLFALPLYANRIGVNSVLFYRYGLALLIYGLWLKFIKNESLAIPKKAILPLFIMGLFFSLSSLLLFEAFNYIEAGIACTLLFVYPVFVAVIMALFFKEKTDKNIIISLLLTSCGISFLYKNTTGASLNIKGVIIVMLASLFYALYLIGVKKIKTLRNIKPNILSFYVMLFGLTVYIYNLDFCTELQMLSKPSLWLYACGLAIIPTIISLETITLAVKLIGSTKTALLGSLEPLTALFIGVAVFHENLTLRIIFGVILILIGVSLIVIKKDKKCLN